jgi:hypothetical protein
VAWSSPRIGEVSDTIFFILAKGIKLCAGMLKENVVNVIGEVGVTVVHGGKPKF